MRFLKGPVIHYGRKLMSGSRLLGHLHHALSLSPEGATEEIAMALTFAPLHPVFVAECLDVDIGEPLSEEDAKAIQDGMDRYAVLVFRRSAPLTTAQQLAFTQALGELEAPYTQI